MRVLCIIGEIMKDHYGNQIATKSCSKKHHGISRPKTTVPPIHRTQHSEASSSASALDFCRRSYSKLSVNDQPYQRDTCVNFRRRAQTGTNSVKSLGDVASYLRDGWVRNVVVCVGAGISTSSGIPDFRTPGSGLYDNLKRYKIPYPEAIFDIDYFHSNPRPFFTLAKELYPSGHYRPNYVHYFTRLLHDKGILLRMYTQNIDGLERIAGIPPQKLVEAHGTFATAKCINCGARYAGFEIKRNIFEGRLPMCKVRNCGGIVKPDIVFFGEDLPKKFYHYLKDMLQADLILVMGTSLEVQPFAGIVDLVRYHVPRVLFNREVVGPFKRPRMKDFTSLGDLVTNLRSFVSKIGWTDDMVDLISQNESSPQEICGDVETRGRITLVNNFTDVKCSNNDISNTTNNREVSSVNSNIKISNVTSNHEDSNVSSNTKISNDTSNHEDSNVSSNTKISNVTSNHEDSNISSKKNNSNITSNHRDRNVSCNDEDVVSNRPGRRDVHSDARRRKIPVIVRKPIKTDIRGNVEVGRRVRDSASLGDFKQRFVGGKTAANKSENTRAFNAKSGQRGDRGFGEIGQRQKICRASGKVSQPRARAGRSDFKTSADKPSSEVANVEDRLCHDLKGLDIGQRREELGQKCEQASDVLFTQVEMDKIEVHAIKTLMGGERTAKLSYTTRPLTSN